MKDLEDKEKEEAKKIDTSIIWNKHTKISLAWAFFSLLLKASSTIWLSLLLNGGSDTMMFVWLGLLLGSNILAPLPDTAVFVGLEKAELESTKMYVSKFRHTHKDKPQLLIDKKLRGETEPNLTAEGRRIYRDGLAIIYNGVLNFSSVAIDIITMSRFVDWRYSVGYGSTIVLFFMGEKCFQGRIETLSKTHQAESNKVTNFLKSGWDNIVVGNKYNRSLWMKKFEEHFNSLLDATVSYTRYVKLSSGLVTFVASLPMFGVTVYLFRDALGKVDRMALLLAIIPRQLQAIQSLNSVGLQIGRWAGVRVNLGKLADSVADDFPGENYAVLTYKVSLSKITVSVNNSSHLLQLASVDTLYEDVMRRTQTKEFGRLTLRGNNATGKSILMCKLACLLLESNRRPIYLPTSVPLLFDSPTDKMSQGERMLAQINEFVSKSDEEIYLLDEWDANLDEINKQKITKLLDTLSKTKVIVEIRHRKDKEVMDLGKSVAPSLVPSKTIDKQPEVAIVVAPVQVQTSDSERKNKQERVVEVVTESPPVLVSFDLVKRAPLREYLISPSPTIGSINSRPDQLSDQFNEPLLVTTTNWLG